MNSLGKFLKSSYEGMVNTIQSHRIFTTDEQAMACWANLSFALLQRKLQAATPLQWEQLYKNLCALAMEVRQCSRGFDSNDRERYDKVLLSFKHCGVVEGTETRNQSIHEAES